jgi:hypothetical protein
MLLPRAEPAVKDSRRQKSRQKADDFVHGRCCLRRALRPHPPRASPASHFVLLTTPPRHPPLYTLLDYAFALISLVTATSVATQKL